MDHRSYLSLFAATLFLCLTQPAPAVCDDLPEFYDLGCVLNPATIAEYPVKDCMFPSLINASEHFAKPLGKYYLYFAPHDVGGIWLAYADSLTGPWTVHKELFNRTWAPHYDVSHISSPSACWINEEKKLFVYFHGENNTTRFATSSDGVNFQYGGVAVTSSMFDHVKDQTSYARVFRYTIPRYGNKYIFLSFGESPTYSKSIWLAYSNDGRTWTAQQKPLIVPDSVPGVEWLCAPTYVFLNGKHYIWYHGDSGGFNDMVTDVYATDVGPDFNTMRYAGKVYDRNQVFFGNGRVGDPFVYQENDNIYLFNAVGTRLHQSINVAVQSKVPLNRPNLARDKPVSVSSFEKAGFEGENAVDGAVESRWASARVDTNWISVDLQDGYGIDGVKIAWENAYAAAYEIQVSTDGQTWTTVYSTTRGDGSNDFINFEPVNARYVRIYGTKRGTQYGYSLWELEVYEAPSSAIAANQASSNVLSVNARTGVIIQYDASRKQIQFTGLESTDQVMLHTLNGRCLKKIAGSPVMDIADIQPQSVLVSVYRNGRMRESRLILSTH